ncbi:MAG: hypothetical protein B6244_09875 [Candidatus Cloacimonetes bacterium 4572_55]|nr:MAG: hypothetical protein B6244_09875 [Candidatus Cloacimonetes bacterium 4572_55]
MEKEEIKQALREVLKEEKWISNLTPAEVQLGDKWRDGSLFIISGGANPQEKEIPIEVFFHKIVMIRDNLRVLEAKVNSNKKLADEEKVGLQQYITRCYGSLTTFNVLFRSREDSFKSSRR